MNIAPHSAASESLVPRAALVSRRPARPKSWGEAALWPLDRARTLCLRLAGPLARPFLRSRDLRVAVGGSTMMALSLLLAVRAPLWLLALGPVLLGVPHVVSDVRYLWAKPALQQRHALAAVIGLTLLAVSVTGEAAVGLGGTLLVVLLSEGALWRRIATLTVGGALLGLALSAGSVANLVFVHVHNVVAIVLWWLWRPSRRGWGVLPLVVFAAGAALILSGTFETWMLRQRIWLLEPGSGALSGLDVVYHLRSLAPGVGPAPWDLRLVLLFAYAQSVHYTVWLRMVPDEARPQETPRTFVASYRALRQDLGTAAVAVCVVAAAAVAVWALFDLAEARSSYLRWSVFHGHLELAALALWAAEGRQRR